MASEAVHPMQHLHVLVRRRVGRQDIASRSGRPGFRPPIVLKPIEKSRWRVAHRFGDEVPVGHVVARQLLRPGQREGRQRRVENERREVHHRAVHVERRRGCAAETR